MERLHPAYFALVMATGIVSVACHQMGLGAIGLALVPVNVVAFAALVALNLARVVRYPQRVLADLVDHQRGVGFFTAVAATSVLGVQLLVLLDLVAIAAALWACAIVLWAVLIYAVFAALTVKERKPSLADGISGGWLVAVVATESISNLGGLLLPRYPGRGELLPFFALCFWLCGGMLYIWMISLIFFRYMFFKFVPSDLMPPYWINMGAVAISTLAGARLALAGGDVPLIASMLPFIKGLTLMFWATATWWIPILVILGVWRHRVRGFALKYDPLYWGLVFPLGMYSVCTLQLSKVLDAPFLLGLSRVFVVLALVAWVLTFFGLATRLLYVLLLATRSRREAAPSLPSVITHQQTGRLS